jgi:hypothetical protein
MRCNVFEQPYRGAAFITPDLQYPAWRILEMREIFAKMLFVSAKPIRRKIEPLGRFLKLSFQFRRAR